MAPLRCAATFDPILALDCAPTPSTLAQSKERRDQILPSGNLASSLKFLVVRHPFRRIASAYVDKFEIGLKSDYIFKTFNK